MTDGWLLKPGLVVCVLTLSSSWLLGLLPCESEMIVWGQFQESSVPALPNAAEDYLILMRATDTCRHCQVC